MNVYSKTHSHHLIIFLFIYLLLEHGTLTITSKPRVIHSCVLNAEYVPSSAHHLDRSSGAGEREAGALMNV